MRLVILYIENNGKHPSLQKLYELATLFHISIDQFFFPDSNEVKTTSRRQLDALLDNIDERDLSVVTATAKALQEIKEAGK